MSITGIQGQLLEVTVIACDNLKDTEWFTKQDPYVCLGYGGTEFCTRTCTDGHTNPTFQEKFSFTLIEGLRELTCAVWNSNTLKSDTFIGSGKVLLQRVLSQGYDDSAWSIQDRKGRYAGKVQLILRYDKALVKPVTSSFAPSTPSSSPLYATQPVFQVPVCCFTSPTAPAAAPYPNPPSASPYAPPAPPIPPPYPYSSYPISNIAAGCQPFTYSASPTPVYPPPLYPPNSTYPPSPYPYPSISLQASPGPGYPPGPYDPGMHPPRLY